VKLFTSKIEEIDARIRQLKQAKKRLASVVKDQPGILSQKITHKLRK